MPMKKTGEVRASGKDLKYIIFGFLLFSVLGGLAWDTENISFCVYAVGQGTVPCPINRQYLEEL